MLLGLAVKALGFQVLISCEYIGNSGAMDVIADIIFQNVYVVSITVRPSVRHFLTEDRAPKLHLHFLCRLFGGLASADCHTIDRVPCIDWCRRWWAHDFGADYRIRCGLIA